MGYLSLLSLAPNAFRSEDLALLEPIADVVAMAVAHARLGAVERDRRRRYEALQALSPVLARALDVREVFDAISEIVRPVVPHDRMALGLLNEDRSAVKAFGLETLPAFLHVNQHHQVEVTAEGWDPAAWRLVAENLSDRMDWSVPLLPANGDPTPFLGTPVAG